MSYDYEHPVLSINSYELFFRTEIDRVVDKFHVEITSVPVLLDIQITDLERV